MSFNPPVFEDVEAAGARLENVAVRTPLLHSDALDAAVGARVFVKPECLQIAGSFKIRGAYNRIVQLTKAERRAGVVAFSSGNHAQGVADAANRVGVSAAIVMPSNAPAVKVRGVQARGAEIVFYDRDTESREEIAQYLATSRGAVLVPSYD
ncbi:MAG: pyridoxal-phosphate dependent enzyme, partial [Pseudomonadota bacterium]